MVGVMKAYSCLILSVLILSVVFVSCASPLFSPKEEVTLLQAIDEAEARGDISTERADGLRAILYNVQNPVGWEEILGGIGGIVAAYFGLRLQTKRDLSKRERTVGTAEDRALLHAMLAEKKAEMAKAGQPLPIHS